MKSPYDFSKRILFIIGGIVLLLVIARISLLPQSWGEKGSYRASSISDESTLPLVHGTNNSCKPCHEETYNIKYSSVHKKLSCESCHAPVSEHVSNNEKTFDMPVKKGEKQRELCLSCHQNTLGRPEKFPMVSYPLHLEKQKVKITHDCSQCHTVHAPLETIHYLRKKTATLREEIMK